MRKTAFTLCLFASAAFAADRIPANSTIYIEPMNGFENSVSAAILKKDVPVRIVDSEQKADYVLTGTASKESAGWAKTIFVSPLPSAHAAVTLKSKDGVMVWAYSVDKSNARKGDQSTAEAIAKHLKSEAIAEVKK